jgi:hypothetical protein
MPKALKSREGRATYLPDTQRKGLAEVKHATTFLREGFARTIFAATGAGMAPITIS